MMEMNGRAFKIKYKDCLYWILWISLFQGIISSYFGLNQINYVCDFLLMVLLVTRLSSERLRHFRINKSIEFIPIIGFVIIILIGWIFNSASLPMLPLLLSIITVDINSSSSMSFLSISFFV